MTFWIIKLSNDDCKYRFKENKRYLCNHKGNILVSCNEKYCPLKI